MIKYNMEMRSFIRYYIALFSIFILVSLGVSYINLNIIKDKVVENNQAILGQILVNRPELEGEIVDIITQGNSKENIYKGKEILGKYNYDENITLRNEPIIYSSKIEVINVNLVFIVCIFTAFIILSLLYFKKIYNDIKDMTDYVYNSSEGRNFEMKNRNQEGQIGILKTELLKMTNILKEKVELLNKEKIFLNDIISDISHQLKTPMTSLIILNDLMYDDLPI